MNEEAIFQAALDRDNPADRDSYLDEMCRADPELRTRVERLLRAHSQPDSIFDLPDTHAHSSALTSHTSPKALGDFDIIREVGRGGMGVVYEAKQVSLNRRVALKVLSTGLGLTSRAVVRFRREAEAAAKLHHTNILPIYSTGDEKGVHYYAMELIEGPSLDRVLRCMRNNDSISSESESASIDDDTGELPSWVTETMAFKGSVTELTKSSGSSSSQQLSRSGSASGVAYFDAIAGKLADVADALDHAHEHGVIHRDIKPANLLLGPDGRLSVNDFGLARVLEQPGMTMSGEFVGSPLYMSPEQITAGRVSVDHRTDIYSLGATLYELLTLQPPFPGTSRDQVIGQILRKEPKAPRRLNRCIPPDLETICLKAIDRDPDRRYQTAGQFAKDLRAHVNRFAISARRVGPVAKSLKWARRNPFLTGIGIVALVAMLSTSLLMAELHRQRRVRLEDLMESTSLFAISGELDKSDEVLREATALNAPAGWQKMLRGQIEIYRGNYLKAEFLLEEAERIMGHNISCSALLAICKFECGEEATYFLQVEELHRMLPENPSAEDLIHLGLAESWSDPRSAVRHLNEAIKERSTSPVLRLVRARSLSFVAWDVTDPKQIIEYADQAIVDSQFARAALSENYYVLVTLAGSHLAKAKAYKELGRAELADHNLSIAEELIPRVAKNTAWRIFLLIESGREDQAIEELVSGDASKALHGTFLSAWTVIAHFRRGEYDKAQDLAHKIVEDGGNVKGGFGFLAELGAESAKDQDVRDALLSRFDAYFKEKRGGEDHISNLDIDWAVARLLQKQEKADKVTKMARKSWGVINCSLIKGLLPALEVMEGNKDISTLELLCKDSRRQLGTLFFVAGIDALADGHRHQAKHYFQRSKDEGYVLFYSSMWSAALLEKLERNPEWPTWIRELEED